MQQGDIGLLVQQGAIHACFCVTTNMMSWSWKTSTVNLLEIHSWNHGGLVATFQQISQAGSSVMETLSAEDQWYLSTIVALIVFSDASCVRMLSYLSHLQLSKLTWCMHPTKICF